MKLLVMRKTLMMRAAVVSSFLAPRIRPAGFSSVSPESPSTCGMTATPVSKPDRPSASFGNTTRAMAIIMNGLPCSAVRASVQSVMTCGSLSTSHRPTATTTTFSAR